MKGWFLYLIIGLFSTVIESSFWGWPWLLVWAWWVAEADEKGVMILLVILGVVLDALMIRPLGISAVVLLVFWIGIKLINQLLGGMTLFLVFYVSTYSLLWLKFLGRGIGWIGGILLVMMWIGVVLLRGQMVFRKEIKLK